MRPPEGKEEVMRVIVALAVTCFLGGSAQATEDLLGRFNYCAIVKADDERLNCFDQLYKDKVGDSEDKVLYSWSGNGIQTTRPFKVSGRWELQWKSDGQYFGVYLYSGSGEMITILANQQGAGSGSAFYPKLGEYYLSTNAFGAWKIQIVSVPEP
jgi:hypothetical protein